MLNIYGLYSDLRECEVDNGGCEQICTDFLGGYNCSCEDGFRPLTNDESSCEGKLITCRVTRTYIVSIADIDECMGDHGCDQTCVNTPGSYYCNCERGFQLINSTECDGTRRAWNTSLNLRTQSHVIVKHGDTMPAYIIAFFEHQIQA